MKRVVSAIFMAMLLTSMLYSAFKIIPAEAAGTIYIRADGSIDPPTAPIQQNGDVYTLTGDINSDADGIVVERDNIVVDGGGHTVQGTGSGTGLSLSGRSNVTIKSITINAFYYGIVLYSSSNSSISGNNITANTDYGIVLYSSSNSSISGNNITDSFSEAVFLLGSDNNTVSENNIKGSIYGLRLLGSSNNTVLGNVFVDNGLLVESSFANIVFDNVVNGKPLVYFEETSDVTVVDAGQVVLVNCDRIRVENLSLSNVEIGVELWETNNTAILGNNITTNKGAGVYLYLSDNNTVSANNMTAGNIGICLDWSDFNTISGNNIAANEYCGVGLSGFSDNNRLFHNNLINNSQQVLTYGTVNFFDDGYPSGGNYWSDYTGVDTNGDGIGDTPYVIDANNQDRYPLVDPWAQAPIRIQGIDVSHYQGDIFWSDVYAADYRFAFAKASEGVGWSDPTFAANMVNGNSAGLYMGAYHFARPDLGNDAVDEALYFVSVARDYLKEGYVRPVLDLEVGSSLGKETLSNWVRTWMETVETETGVEPIIYTGGDYVNPDVDILDASLTEYDLWIAHWTYDPTASPNTGIWSSWAFWQYSNIGAVSGIVGGVDLDLFNGDLQDLYRGFVIPISGDVNRDRNVDIFDCVIIALAFSSTPSDPNWNPVADINNDGIVDIFDIVVVALHFGETS